jgi:hypothetical protein
MRRCLIKHRENIGGTLYHSWLRHYATSREVVGSIPDEVIGFFNWPNPSSRTRALGSTQPLTEMSTRNIPGGKGRRVLINSPPSVSRLFKHVAAWTSHNHMGLHGLLQGQLYLPPLQEQRYLFAFYVNIVENFLNNIADISWQLLPHLQPTDKALGANVILLIAFRTALVPKWKVTVRACAVRCISLL